MNRPQVLLPSLLTLGLLLGSCHEAGPAPAEGSELFVLVIVDTLRRDALGCYGNEEARTPNIDALAAEGARFDQGISSSGWTLPSVASILTGTWPSLHKATGKSTRLTPITPDLPVAAEVFQEAGFATLGFVNAAFLSPLLGLGRGFDVFDHEHAYNLEIRRADATVDAALGAIAERPGQKVFALVHLFDAHLDYDPPAGFREGFFEERDDLPTRMSMLACRKLAEPGGRPSARDLAYVRGLYQAEVSFVDRAVGRLVGGLRELGRWDQTTLVLTADHGEEFWDHGGFEHGHTLYDELIRVPLIVHLPPGRASQPRVVDEQVRILDVMPTLFELAGLETPSSFLGESLLPCIEGAAGAPRVAFSQSTLYGANKLSWRSDPYQLIYDLDPEVEQRVELYDFRADPATQDDLALERPAVASRLQKELAGFYSDLKQRAKTITTPTVEDMSPSHVHEYLESINSLGYAGELRDEDEEAGGAQ